MFQISFCSEFIIVKAGLPASTAVFWVIRPQKNCSIYQKQVVTDADGNLQIAVADLPAGLINPHSGVFELRIKSAANYLETILMTLNEVAHESVFFRCIEVFDPVELNYTISSETIYEPAE